MQATQIKLTLGMAALSLAACSAQVDSDYRGESLAAVKLAVAAAPGEFVPDSTAVGLIWDLIDPEGYDQGTQFGEVVDVTGDVTEDTPSNIVLDLSQPPPEPLLVEMADGNALAVARIMWVYLEGFDPVPGGGFSSFGSAEDHVVVYLAEDAVADGATSRFLHATPSAGYHIFSVDQPPPTECMLASVLDARLFPRHSGDCPRNALSLAPEDLDTTVLVTPGYGELIYEDIETAW